MAKKAQKTQKENSDKYERQKKMTAERQQRFKARMTEEQLEKKRKRDRERRKRLREEKKIKPISEMKASEQKKTRKEWRKYSATYRAKQKTSHSVLGNTPPSSNTEENQEPQVSRQKESGRKQIRRDRAKAYKTINKQAEEIKNLQRKLEKYKKRLLREKTKQKKNCSPSPAKKVKEIVGVERVSPKIKKRLFVGFALEKQLQTQIKGASPKTKDRQLMLKAIGSKVLKKYRVQKVLKNIVSYRTNKLLKEDEGQINLNYTRKQYQTVRVKEVQALRKFFEDDTVSKMCPGKKDFVCKGKLKLQRRILQDSMKHLYKRFIEETNFKISYSTFTRSRPFWVTFPKAQDRETCACMKHENFEFLVTALKKGKIIEESNSHDVLRQIVCSVKNEKCMKGLCKTCKSKEIVFTMKEDERIKYFKWIKVTEDRIIKGKVKKVKRVVKKEENALASEVINTFKNVLPVYKNHVHSMLHQADQLQNLKNNLKEGELLLQVDFSQNYVAKCATEVQAMHFGASKKQISLHTGVCYHREDDKIMVKSFCTISDNLDHHCHGVWAHLRPVLENLAVKFPNVNTVHIFSDGPSSQYRNKGNLFLMRTLLPVYFKNLKKFTWNYSEPGHGKGSMDGVGGSIKRCADSKVRYGRDITSAADLVDSFTNETSIKLFEVSHDEVEEAKKLLPNKLSVVKGIMQVKQFCFEDGNVHGRKLSCFQCKMSEQCIHYPAMMISATGENPECSKPKRKRTQHSTSSGACSKKNKVLKVEDVYTSSSASEDEFEHPSSPTSPVKLEKATTYKPDTFVVVTLEEAKSKKSRNFVGVVQLFNNTDEVKIMFMKNCSKDKFMFFPDENDVSYVSCAQIVGVLPTPKIIQKGNRLFYKFSQKLQL